MLKDIAPEITEWVNIAESIKAELFKPNFPYMHIHT